jgi:hypothetical protein
MKPTIHLLEDFCMVKAHGTWYENTDEMPPRVGFICDLLTERGITFIIDKWKAINGTPLYNVYVPGTSKLMVIAHHDINNKNSQNANDNSASVINAIYLKEILPQATIAFTDGEEFGGIGAQRLADKINDGSISGIEAVLNLELTGRGGKNFMIGRGRSEENNLRDWVASEYACPIVNVPFNDSYILENNGINSCVINPLPTLTEPDLSSRPLLEHNGHKLDSSILYLCHSKEDTWDKCNFDEMTEFVSDVLVPLVTGYEKR